MQADHSQNPRKRLEHCRHEAHELTDVSPVRRRSWSTELCLRSEANSSTHRYTPGDVRPLLSLALERSVPIRVHVSPRIGGPHDNER